MICIVKVVNMPSEKPEGKNGKPDKDAILTERL
jgi:hypothetical protein